MKTDYHCHILPGIDDGAKNIDESLYLAKQLIKWGFQRAICTSHIAYMYRNTPQTIEKACNVLRQALQEQDIALELVPSAEYRLLPETWYQVLQNKWFLPWDERYLLLELPIRAKEQLGDIDPIQEVKRIQELGFTPVIAHPERYAYLSLNEIVDFCKQGALLQINYPSLCGKYGEETKQKAKELLSKGYISFYGTDLHSKAHVDCLNNYFYNYG